MKLNLKLAILLFIFGLVVGFILHGAIETLVIWVLLNFLPDFFLKISWQAWLLIHLIFSIIIEILGVILVFWSYKKIPWKLSVL